MTIKSRRIAGFLVAVSMLVASGPGMAAKEVHPSCGPPGTWCSLGKVTASRDRDHDTIEIKGSDDEIPKGGESRSIDLRGSGKRSLKRVEFWYESKGLLNGKADVKLFGLR
jgi:hypothetical protein